ncbi:MAG: hypothetical protein ACKO2L_03760 [Planctomycetaceae bacterium]
MAMLWWMAAFELVTLVLRFGFSLESTRDTASTVGLLTAGLRVHHSYVGMLLLPVAAWLPQRAAWLERRLAAIAAGLVLSDLVHHFVVLWLITGSAQFDLFY